MSPCYLARVRAFIRSSLQGRRRKHWPEHGGSRIPKTFRLYPADEYGTLLTRHQTAALLVTGTSWWLYMYTTSCSPFVDYRDRIIAKAIWTGSGLGLIDRLFRCFVGCPVLNFSFFLFIFQLQKNDFLRIVGPPDGPGQPPGILYE
jgi:hypothetical protein